MSLLKGESVRYPAMIIDFHTHIFPPRIKQDRDEYIKRDPHFAELYSNPKAILATADELIASMDECSIDTSVALNFSWATHELCAETNDYILESVARYPHRLTGFCTVQLKSPEDAIAEIERCAAAGARGVGEMRLDRQSLDLQNSTVMKSVVQAITKLRLILLTHASEPVGHQYPGKGDSTPDVLYNLITRFPDLTVVCAHWGGGLPFYALMPEVKQAMKNVFFDTAASPFLYQPQVYQQIAQLAGADRILFGSDYPLLAPSRLINEIKTLNLSGETESLILYRNAQRLLDIQSSPDRT